MKLSEIEKRLAALEKSVRRLTAQGIRPANGKRRWWVEDAGRFANDPLFDEIVRLGREYRESLGGRRAKRKK